ncbi:MAG TPA: hypothetical protein VEC14_02190 [Reyranellaceae bacterium]|nr:hypothetical protein [Reyranellaceae bacterium]
MNYTVKDLAPRLRRTCDWIYQHQAELEAAGFPPPLPIPGRPRVWPADKVDAFLAGERPPAPPTPSTEPAAIAAQRQARRERAAAIAARQGAAANDR